MLRNTQKRLLSEFKQMHKNSIARKHTAALLAPNKAGSIEFKVKHSEVRININAGSISFSHTAPFAKGSVFYQPPKFGRSGFLDVDLVEKSVSNKK